MDPPTTAGDGKTTTANTHEGLQHRGRPLDASRDVALREAALELLAEHGYDCLTIDSIAARARASKVTIYRRWSGKAELVVDALSSRRGSPATSDTGSLRGDLEAIARNATSTDSRFDAQLRMGLFTALARDAELRQVFRERLVDPHIANLKQVFQRAAARGEISEERNLDLLVLVLPALISHHLLIFGEAPDSKFVKRVIDDVVVPLAIAPTNSGERQYD